MKRLVKILRLILLRWVKRIVSGCKWLRSCPRADSHISGVDASVSETKIRELLNANSLPSSVKSELLTAMKTSTSVFCHFGHEDISPKR